MKYFLILILLCFFNSCSMGQLNFKANDNVPKDIQEELNMVLNMLYSACQQKDTAQLFKMIDKNVYNAPSYGNDGMVHNLQAFKDYWGMSNPEHSLVWEIIIDNLKSGGNFIPSYESNVPSPIYIMPNFRVKGDGPLDIAEFSRCRINVIDSLAIYSTSSGDSIIGYLDRSAIVCDDAFSKYGYGLVDGLIQISVKDAKINGWVNGRYLYKWDWKITISKINGVWKISSFSLFE